MSGEQKASHIRREPFMKVSDFEDEPLPRPNWTLEKLAKVMIDGFNETHVRIDSLATRVETVEAAAVWKQRAVKALKYAAPTLIGAVAARYPDVAKILGALLTGVQ